MTKSTPAKLAYQRAYNARPEETKKRSANDRARDLAVKEGRAKVGDGKDIAHKKSLENGGSNDPSNLEVQSRKKNRGWRKGSASYNPDKSTK